jgi:GNAT superfamily N-acetyltransferase
MSVGYRIRDGLVTDIPRCVALDHHFKTEYVWQMQFSVANLPQSTTIQFKTERLPRPLEGRHHSNAERLQHALTHAGGVIVATSRDDQALMAYLGLSAEPTYQRVRVHDLVVDSAFRRRRLAARLIAVARQWGQERGLQRLLIETTTQNYPMIQCCQTLGLTFCGYNDHYFPNQDIAIFFSQSLR